ncbi:SCO family protein [Psychrobium sp. 1_MG-2023]|uniref:SCO family protein n=1 Tax=Psychrobium sp. 1_MG-2023 TaxID=3062624 RepID=UPI000C34C5AE|nr:SCO family protein [Psychrobium sp. 1_MG-2023]MDP2561835.1 SCO family protein [Psychrobium sp. 1_MG-2023]PKF55793.1 SCO family protein [Alteromonadales bacterium alter-6D02]
MNKVLLTSAAIVAIAGGITANMYFSSDSITAQQVERSVPEQTVVKDKGSYRLFEPAKKLPKFELQRSGIEGFTEQDLIGKWTFVSFGYTYCPDICPTTLTRIKAVYPQLKNIAAVQVIFVSADPLRDDVERLAQYVNFFDSSFLGLTANHDKLFPFAQSLFLPYGIIATKKSDDYQVNHSASIALINPQGKLHAQFKPVHQVGEVPIVDMKVMADSFADIVATSDGA